MFVPQAFNTSGNRESKKQTKVHIRIFQIRNILKNKNQINNFCPVYLNAFDGNLLYYNKYFCSNQIEPL